MKITRVRINHMENPIGFKFSSIRVSWNIVDVNESKELKSRIIVATDMKMENILYDTGMKILDFRGTILDISVNSQTRYYLKVLVYDGKEYTESEIAFFETAKDKIWKARFITPIKDYSPIIYREFNIPKKVQSAKIYICGLGVYEAYLNKRFINEEYLMPGYHSYDSYYQYQTYDITNTISIGENILEIPLGDGWYKGRLMFGGGFKNIYGDKLALIFEVHIYYEDGEKEVICSDLECKSKPSSIVQSSIYDGEIYNANMEDIEQVDKVRYIDLDTNKLIPRYSLPIIIKRRINPIQLIITEANEQILDFGQNITGWVEFESSDDIKLSFGEILQNEHFYNENYRTAIGGFTYISNKKKRKVRPHFTFFGFRYVKVQCKERVDINKFEAVLITSKLEDTGKIITNNEKINQLISNAQWSQWDNFLDVPTDCPQRDERLGWTGDAQIFSGTASFNSNTAAFFRKYLNDMLSEQLLNDGGVPYIVPTPKPKIENFMLEERDENIKLEKGNNLIKNCKGIDASPWGDAAAIIPWNVYQFFGDKELLEETYINMKLWVDHIIKKNSVNDNPYLFEQGFHFADWLALDNPNKKSPFGSTDSYYVASVFYYHSVLITSLAANELEKKEAKEYREFADKIRYAIQQRYFEDGLCTIDTQTAYILAVYFYIVDKEDIIKNVDALVYKLKDNNYHLDTGFVGTPYINFVLSQNGHVDIAYKLLFNEEYPGWLYEVNLGATTIWERWNSVLCNGQMNPEGMNSLNHYAYGSILEWIYREVCGLNQIDVGFKKVKIEPKPDKHLKYINMEYISTSGTYKIYWRFIGIKEFELIVEVPYDCSATIILPFKKTYEEVESGIHRYRYEI